MYNYNILIIMCVQFNILLMKLHLLLKHTTKEDTQEKMPKISLNKHILWISKEVVFVRVIYNTAVSMIMNLHVWNSDLSWLLILISCFILLLLHITLSSVKLPDFY